MGTLMEKIKWLKCPACDSYQVRYAFSFRNHRIVKCNFCELMGLSPQPSDEVLKEIYGASYFPFSTADNECDHIHRLKQQTALRYIQHLETYLADLDRPGRKGQLLEIGVGLGDFLKVASDRGYAVRGVEYSESAVANIKKYFGESLHVSQGEIFDISEENSFDAVVFNDVLEHVRDPLSFLGKIHSILADEGVILCSIPSLDSWSARWQGTSWVEFKLEHLFYFNKKNASRLLNKTGFTDIVVFPATKTLSLLYIVEHFELHPRRFWSKLFRFVKFVMPNFILKHPFSIVASGIVIMATKGSLSKTIKTTAIMAVYNEKETVRRAIEGVLSKEVRDCEIDLIIVESNSTDGSREIVNSYKGNPRVTILLEDRPRGKGHAVRQGLKMATGDIILIQDADMEYDFEDYDSLLETLRDGAYAFVLGSRHGGGKWKVRNFEGQPVVAFLANSVHWILTIFINLLYGVKLTDPFTMFKVFRRSAIQGLDFNANRFDFDYELLLKLIRRGYRPIEVPVNYTARSFKQGKKVRFFRDPLTWVWAILKYRFCKL